VSPLGTNSAWRKKTRVADVGQTAANPRAVNAGSMVSYATSTVIKGKKTCCVSCVWSVTKWGVGKDEIKQINLENW
jgi:hypothetical protein